MGDENRHLPVDVAQDVLKSELMLAHASDVREECVRKMAAHVLAPADGAKQAAEANIDQFWGLWKESSMDARSRMVLEMVGGSDAASALDDHVSVEDAGENTEDDEDDEDEEEDDE